MEEINKIRRSDKDSYAFFITMLMGTISVESEDRDEHGVMVHSASPADCPPSTFLHLHLHQGMHGDMDMLHDGQ